MRSSILHIFSIRQNSCMYHLKGFQSSVPLSYLSNVPFLAYNLHSHLPLKVKPPGAEDKVAVIVNLQSNSITILSPLIVPHRDVSSPIIASLEYVIFALTASWIEGNFSSGSIATKITLSLSQNAQVR